MANRSYVYELKNNKHISIGECPYKIPYSFRILASYDNEVADSSLFDKKVGIRADFLKGKTALYYLLDFLSSTNQMLKQNEFDGYVEKTKSFLDTIDADQLLLENGEIYALYTDKDDNYLTGEGLERANNFDCEDYKWIGEDIDHLKNTNISPSQIFDLKDEQLADFFKWIIDLRNEWETQLGLDCWANILYFQFKDENP